LLGSPCPLLAFNIDDGFYFIEIVEHLFREWPPTCASTMEEDWPVMALGLYKAISPKIASILPTILNIYLVNYIIIYFGYEN